ncbi:unnamed protein product [Peronospora destructor]|uniref:VWFA domain-containing protein n=1 Tax=Peronospora destructor TaxID=86335 RepID=A0AAV0UM50_9STRA|nr:unnamed protein product [Peronospora destructor]
MATSCAHDGHAHDSALNDSDKDEDYDKTKLAFDPTLASCCERDEHEYKKAMKLKAVLTAHDPTSGAVRMRQQVFQPPPVINTIKSQSSVMEHEILQSRVSLSDSDDFDDSDDDFGIETMLAVRRKQLEQQLQEAAQYATDGYSVVLDSDLLHFVQELRDEPDVPRVALVVDSSASMKPEFMRVMRSEMAAVAQKFLGTKVYVAMVARDDDDVLRQLRLPVVSSLAAFSRGELVSFIALDPKTLVTELLWEARFVPWLTKCCVLTSERISQQTSRSNPSRREIANEDGKEQLGFDCGMEGCRLRFEYTHEHVGASQQTKDEIAAWRQAFE